MEFRISRFDGVPDITCQNSTELRDVLQRLNIRGFEVPTMVNIYDDLGRIAIIGLGSELSTVQLVDRPRGKNHRSITTNKSDVDRQFIYQGEATFVRPKFL